MAIIFGGQPGSGQSAAVAEALSDLIPLGGAVAIVGDDSREYHPDNTRPLEADDRTAARPERDRALLTRRRRDGVIFRKTPEPSPKRLKAAENGVRALSHHDLHGALMRRTIIATVIAALLIPAGAALGTVDIRKGPFDKIDEYIGLRDRLASADDHGSWLPFTSSEKAKVQKNIDSYLDDALKILLDDSLVDMKDKIIYMQHENQQLEKDIADFQLDKSFAPIETKKYEVWKSSISDLDDKIANCHRKIASNKRMIQDLKNDIQSNLAKVGIILTEEHINSIFLTISGQDQLDSLVVIKNLYDITDILQNLIKSSSNLSVSKKYYGVFLLAYEAHQKQLATCLSLIDDVYMPKLDDMRTENNALMASTKTKSASKEEYERLVTAQRITEEVAIKYGDLLRSQRSLILDRLTALEEVIEYTETTYRTVSLASGLSDLMDESVDVLAELIKMPIVPPLAFDNTLEDKFLEITEKLAVD